MTNRKTEITEAAIELIANKGIQGCTIKNLANKVGLSEAALYRHFKNKQAIFQGVIDSFSKLDSPCLEGNESSLVKIKNFLNDRFFRFAQNPLLAKVVLSEAIFQNDPVISKSVMIAMHKHRNILGKVIDEGQRANEIRADIGTQEIFRIIAGSMRITVTQWQLTNFLFNLENEGKKITAALLIMLKKND